jgi:hypothetical protein
MGGMVRFNQLHRARTDLKRILAGDLEFKRYFGFEIEEWRETAEFVAEKVQREIMRDHYYEDRSVRRDIRPFPNFDTWLKQLKKQED